MTEIDKLRRYLVEIRRQEHASQVSARTADAVIGPGLDSFGHRELATRNRFRSTTKTFPVADDVVGSSFLGWEVLGFCTDW